MIIGCIASAESGQNKLNDLISNPIASGLFRARKFSCVDNFIL